MQNDKVEKLKNLRNEPVQESGLSAMFQVAPPVAATKKADKEKKKEVRISFFISNDHDKDIKMFCARTGKKFKNIVVAALEEFFKEGATRQIENPRMVDGSGTKQAGVNIPIELKEQLDEYVAKEKIAMRFVVEALVNEYISK